MTNLKDEEFRAWNEKMIHRYNPAEFHRHPNPIIRWIEANRVKQIIQMLKIHPDHLVLDVGCGCGDILNKITTGHLYGVDLSEMAIQNSKKRLGKRAKLQLANAECLPFSSESFNRIYCSEVLEHVLHPKKVLEELKRVCKKKGLIVVSIPNEGVINLLKKTLIKLGLFKFMAAPRYQTSKNMADEWHLHELNMPQFKKQLPESLSIHQVIPIPAVFLPIRYVISLNRKDQS